MTPTEELARYLNAYARRHAAGAFATPTAAELSKADVITWDHDGGRHTAAVVKRLTRDSVRTDWLGEPYTLPRGADIVTHLARDPGAPVPDLDAYHAVFAYADDLELSHGLEEQGRERMATRISAASEIITCWGWEGTERPTPPVDAITVLGVADISEGIMDDALGDLSRATGWADDYPYYNRDGSWSALSLRGFDTDPAWGVKPAEMGRKWNDAHPGALRRTCVWTTLADTCPILRALAECLPGRGLERVRLMRMTTGKLLRHTDITDKASGIRDGQVARFHLPLVTGPRALLHTWLLNGAQIDHHLSAGTWWYLDARKPHAVTQGEPDLERIHLVADVICDQSTRNYLEASACSAAT